LLFPVLHVLDVPRRYSRLQPARVPARASLYRFDPAHAFASRF